MTRVVDIVDTTTRDGNQSLWGATGLTAARHPRDRADAGARRLPRARLHLEHAHGRVGALPPRGPVGADPADARGDAATRSLNFITTGMRFIAWQPCDEDVMRLAFRCVVRNGIRRFQFAEPANDPEALRRVARMAREEGRRGDRRRAHLLDQPRAHARLLRRAGRGARRLRRHRPLLPQGPGRPADDRRRARAGAALRRDRAHGRAAQPLHDRARAAGLPGGLEAGFDVLHTAIGPAGNGTSQPTVESTLRNLEAEGYDAPARRRGARATPASTSASSCARSACRRACRASTTPPTTTTSCRAGW